MSSLQKQAIQASLDNNWEVAIDLNNMLLEECPTDLAALNRLARAYIELGQKESAKTVYQKVLSIDKYNPIASKNLRLLPGKNGNMDSRTIVENFVEEAGITKAVTLVKTASKEVLLSLVCKQSLSFTPRARLIAVVADKNVYIGCLPDDLSLKLKKNLASGYKYSVCLKSASDSAATIFIREVKRPNRIMASPTFSRMTPMKKTETHTSK